MKQSYSKTSWSNDLLTKVFKDLQKRVEALERSERSPKQTSSMSSSKLSYRLSCTEKALKQDMDDVLADSDAMKTRFEDLEARTRKLEAEVKQIVKMLDGILDLID